MDYDVYRTVTSHTFHELSPKIAYTVTIIAVNEAGSGPPVSVNVTTQGAPSGNRAICKQVIVMLRYCPEWLVILAVIIFREIH